MRGPEESMREESLALLSSLVLFAGLVLLAEAPRAAGFLLIAGLTTRITAHVVGGILRYRRIMSHPWPRVAAVADDDW